jgi:inosine-uridine nucleoside N-ribohydrolase
MLDSYDEIGKLLSMMNAEREVSVYRGAEHEIPDESTPVVSAGADLIVREAMVDDPAPLFVIFLGPITDLACAYLMKPAIAGRLTAVWIGGGQYPYGGKEFNLGNDIHAANAVMASPLELWQIPINVYTAMRTSLAELALKVKPYGRIGEYLFQQMIEYNMAHGSDPHFPKGEMWSLGDSPAVSVLLDPHRFCYELRPAPRINPDMTYTKAGNSRLIRVYNEIDARFTLEDMFAKIALFHHSLL